MSWDHAFIYFLFAPVRLASTRARVYYYRMDVSRNTVARGSRMGRERQATTTIEGATTMNRTSTAPAPKLAPVPELETEQPTSEQPAVETAPAISPEASRHPGQGARILRSVRRDRGRRACSGLPRQPGHRVRRRTYRDGQSARQQPDTAAHAQAGGTWSPTVTATTR